MAEADVGDDGYGEDPTVRALEETYAERVAKEAALYVPSGTMANQVALRLHGRIGTLAIAGRGQHLVVFEGGAAAANGVVQLCPVDDPHGLPDLAQVTEVIEAAGHHQPPVSVICAENTHMPAGGVAWGVEQLAALADFGVPVHLDGARLFNAEVALGVPAAELARRATTVMSCLSKGLGAPVGSVLAGPADLVAAARDERHRLGGGMRQAGVIAAAGLVALTRMVDRLADDHRRAHRLATAVAERWPDSIDPETVRTNMVVFGHRDTDALLDHLARAGVRAGTIAPGTVRLVTHLDVDDDGLDRACKALADAP